MSVVADQPAAAGESLDPPVVSLWRFTVDQYHEMVRKGIVTEDDRVELLEGLLVKKMTISPPHRRSTHRVQNGLRRVLPSGHYIGSPSPITLPTSEPEPDVVVVRGSDDDYPDRHPGPGDVVLVVEVSDSSLRRDEGFKKRIYARAGVPVYWIINLIDRRVEAYGNPTGPAEKADYLQRQDYGEADQLPLVIDGREVARIPVRDLLP